MKAKPRNPYSTNQAATVGRKKLTSTEHYLMSTLVSNFQTFPSFLFLSSHLIPHHHHDSFLVSPPKQSTASFASSHMMALASVCIVGRPPSLFLPSKFILPSQKISQFSTRHLKSRFAGSHKTALARVSISHRSWGGKSMSRV